MEPRRLVPRVYAANTYATDDLVFGEPGDLVLLGSRSLEGLNVRVDPIAKVLIDAGPMPMVGTGPLRRVDSATQPSV